MILLPYYGRESPYLPLLAGALGAEGVRVHLGRLHRCATMWRAALKHGRPDIIHLQWQHAFLTGRSLPLAAMRTLEFFLQFLVLRLLGVRFVWTVHNVINHAKQQASWELRACWLLARVVDRMIVHCAAAVPIVASFYRVTPQRLAVVPIGHYGDWYPPLLSKSEARQLLNLPSSVLVFLYFGLVKEYKGLEHLLEAFADLEAENIRLILAGRAGREALRQDLAAKAAADPRVAAHLEFVSDDLLISYLSACDLVVLPYRDILTSSSAILAAQYARPILAPRVGCLQELPAEASILYDPEAERGLGCALEQALSAPLESMGLAARDYVEQFPWSLAAERMLAVYESVLNRQGVRRGPIAVEENP